MPIASCGGRRAGPRPALGEVPPTRTGCDKGAATLGELRMRTACLVVFASLFLVAVVGSALAQKECEDELGNTYFLPLDCYQASVQPGPCPPVGIEGRRSRAGRPLVGDHAPSR